jgi:RNA polymerase sigma-70 factor (ECF subfamily)
VFVRTWSVPSDDASDETLLAAMALGDPDAGLVLVRRHQRAVYGLAYGMVGDAALADDVAQEAFVRVWRHAAVFDRRRGTASAWMLTITRNLAIDALRTRRAVPTDPDDLVDLRPTHSRGAPDEQAVLTDASERVRRALADLPEPQRRAVVLASFYGRTAEEISVQERIPVGTAKTRIRAGLGKLRTALAEQGLPT